MTLEERLTVLAAKGQLVHLSLAFYGDQYHCNFATAQAAGYARCSDADPIKAIDGALKALPVRATRKTVQDEPDVTAAVIADAETKTGSLDGWTA